MNWAPVILGAHLPTSRGLESALARAGELGLNCLQLFSKSPRIWRTTPLDPERAAAWRAAWQSSGLGPLVVHDSYLINLASPDEAGRRRSIEAMIDEIERADLLGADWLVTHCGAHLGEGEENGLRLLEASLRECLGATGGARVRIALENTAAQGTCLGGPFEHIARVLDALDSPRVGACFDSCHAHAAGHDLCDDPTGVVAHLDGTIGATRLGVIHLNDAKGERGGHLDRHAHLGQGAIGQEPLRALIQHPLLNHLPFVLETPEVESQIARNIATARCLAATCPDPDRPNTDLKAAPDAR